MIRLDAFVLSIALASPAAAHLAPPDTSQMLAQLRAESRELRPLLRSKLARQFAAATSALPGVEPRTLHYDSLRTRYWTESEFRSLPDTTRERALVRTFGEDFYYTTRYGSPLAYSRPLEILDAAGLREVSGKRIADFGYGTIGHLRLLAQLGADVHGIEADPLLRALYSSDQGEVRGGGGRAGRLTLHHGRWPAEGALVAEAGDGYDLFLSKNTLKNGYIHPAEAVNPRMLVHLGVGDTAYVEALARTVKRGGLVLIYNLCPAPAPPGKPYIPWARELWERAGFEVVAFDRDDSPAARAMGHALGWDQGEQPMDLAANLFATYSLFRRKR
jgi:hypothetical protein